MDRLEVSTDVFVAPARVYEFLVDFPGYAQYSEYLESVEQRGDGDVGTVYDITASWWRLTHTVSSEVTDVEPPERIDWRLQGPIDASGAWLVDARDPAETAAPVAPPDDVDVASRVALVVEYDPSTVSAGRFDLPALISLDAVVDRVVPLVEDEARRTVERIVADLEGEHRRVDLRVETGADSGGVDTARDDGRQEDTGSAGSEQGSDEREGGRRPSDAVDAPDTER